MHQSFLDHAGRRYLKAALALCAASIALYLWHDPRSPPNGGTWLGYTLGGIGAALILWLTALGIRKRSYASSLGTVQGWVSAHVYLGLALIVVATLHAGFQFGWNIHTLCYALMVVVIVSGLVGVVLYRRYPEQMSRNRVQQTQDGMLEEIGELDARALRIAKQLPPEFDAALRANMAGTHIGGGALAILSARDRSEVALPGAASVGNVGQGRMLDWLGGQLSRSTDPERSRLVNDLLSIVGARRVLLRRLQRDARMRAWLEAWLYLHVPVTFGLLGALIAHVVSVFLYW
ncbi:MAG: hypothetical protein ACKO7G_06925 [Gammaproteobacteria bacterium]